MMGPEHPGPRTRFLGGCITNDWQALLRETMVYFQWIANVDRKRKGDKTVSAYQMALLSWV